MYFLLNKPLLFDGDTATNPLVFFVSAADLFSACRCSWHLLILQLIFHLLSLLNYKTHNRSVPRKLYLLHGRYTMMGITHVGLFTAGKIYGSVVSPPPSYWFPPIAPSLISPTTLGLFSSDPNNHWDEPQGRRLCSLSLHFQHHSRISIVITIILLLPLSVTVIPHTAPISP